MFYEISFHDGTTKKMEAADDIDLMRILSGETRPWFPGIVRITCDEGEKKREISLESIQWLRQVYNDAYSSTWP